MGHRDGESGHGHTAYREGTVLQRRRRADGSGATGGLPGCRLRRGRGPPRRAGGPAPPRRGGGQLPPDAGPGPARRPTARPGSGRHPHGCGRPGARAGRRRAGRHLAGPAGRERPGGDPCPADGRGSRHRVARPGQRRTERAGLGGQGYLFRRLRDQEGAGPRRHGRRLRGPTGQPQSPGGPEDDQGRRAGRRRRAPPVPERGRGGRAARPPRHRADLRGRPARRPALLQR